MNLIIVIKKKTMRFTVPLPNLYQARVTGEVKEAQEQMKADMEAMKEQMATLMEAMMSMK